MASSAATARLRADALKTLKETGPQIAAQLGIEPPALNFFYKDADYQQAQELTALAEFNTRLLAALPNPSEGSEDDQPGPPSTEKRGSRRSAASQRNAG